MNASYENGGCYPTITRPSLSKNLAISPFSSQQGAEIARLYNNPSVSYVNDEINQDTTIFPIIRSVTPEDFSFSTIDQPAPATPDPTFHADADDRSGAPITNMTYLMDSQQDSLFQPAADDPLEINVVIQEHQRSSSSLNSSHGSNQLSPLFTYTRYLPKIPDMFKPRPTPKKKPQTAKAIINSCKPPSELFDNPYPNEPRPVVSLPKRRSKMSTLETYHPITNTAVRKSLLFTELPRHLHHTTAPVTLNLLYDDEDEPNSEEIPNDHDSFPTNQLRRSKRFTTTVAKPRSPSPVPQSFELPPPEDVTQPNPVLASLKNRQRPNNDDDGNESDDIQPSEQIVPRINPVIGNLKNRQRPKSKPTLGVGMPKKPVVSPPKQDAIQTRSGAKSNVLSTSKATKLKEQIITERTSRQRNKYHSQPMDVSSHDDTNDDNDDDDADATTTTTVIASSATTTTSKSKSKAKSKSSNEDDEFQFDNSYGESEEEEGSVMRQSPSSLIEDNASSTSASENDSNNEEDDDDKNDDDNNNDKNDDDDDASNSNDQDDDDETDDSFITSNEDTQFQSSDLDALSTPSASAFRDTQLTRQAAKEQRAKKKETVIKRAKRQLASRVLSSEEEEEGKSSGGRRQSSKQAPRQKARHIIAATPSSSSRNSSYVESEKFVDLLPTRRSKGSQINQPPPVQTEFWSVDSRLRSQSKTSNNQFAII